MLKVVLVGSKWIGEQVLVRLHRTEGVRVVSVASPEGDRLHKKAMGYLKSGMIDQVTTREFKADDVPQGTDLIVTAGSRWFVSEKARHRSRLGGIGYHPSLLPLHRGADAVRWAIRMGDKVTGGTVYQLTNKVDGGGIISQKHVFIRPNDTAETLWRRELAQLGVDLIANAVETIAKDSFVHCEAQDEALATWEPSIDRPPVARPDLFLLEKLEG